MPPRVGPDAGGCTGSARASRDVRGAAPRPRLRTLTAPRIGLQLQLHCEMVRFGCAVRWGRRAAGGAGGGTSSCPQVSRSSLPWTAGLSRSASRRGGAALGAGVAMGGARSGARPRGTRPGRCVGSAGGSAALSTTRPAAALGARGRGGARGGAGGGGRPPRGPRAAGAGVAAEAVARGLGYVVVGGSVFRAAPQLIRILRRRSAEGVALSSFAVEFVAYTVTAAYNLRRGFPFSTYGEIWFCWMQTIGLLALVMHFQRTPRARAAALTLALAAWASLLLLSGAVPLPALMALQAAAPVGVALGRVPQIAMNFRNGHTGQLSLGMCAINAVGTGIRVFTTAVVTGDLVLLAGFALVFAVNGLLVAQCLQTRLKIARGELKLGPGAT